MRTREGMAIARAKGRLRQSPQAQPHQTSSAAHAPRGGRPHDRRTRRTVLSQPRDGLPRTGSPHTRTETRQL
jgi:hypothetical protein